MILGLVIWALILTGCNIIPQPEATATAPQPTAMTPFATLSLGAGATMTASPTAVSPTNTAEATLSPTNTAEATLSPTATMPSPDPEETIYLDDRSDPIAVLNSLVNAINRHEYLRAYSYWEENAIDLPPYEQFAQGYEETASVQLQTGMVYGGVAAGNTFYDVPVALLAQTEQGVTQTFTGCYRLHLGNPAIQGALPFRPLGIQSAQINQVDNNADIQSLLEQQCLNENEEPNGQPFPIPTPPAPEVVSADRYLDDRSNATQVMRSFVNAINRREYIRAYDYWENQAALGPLEDFISGYENTESVQLFTGTEITDAGAGQRYSQVPVVMIAQISGGEVQTFSGCYAFHLSSPAIQATPPFQPWGIQSATTRRVANGSDVDQLLAQACAGS